MTDLLSVGIFEILFRPKTLAIALVAALALILVLCIALVVASVKKNKARLEAECLRALLDVYEQEAAVREAQNASESIAAPQEESAAPTASEPEAVPASDVLSEENPQPIAEAVPTRELPQESDTAVEEPATAELEKLIEDEAATIQFFRPQEFAETADVTDAQEADSESIDDAAQEETREQDAPARESATEQAVDEAQEPMTETEEEQSFAQENVSEISDAETETFAQEPMEEETVVWNDFPEKKSVPTEKREAPTEQDAAPTEAIPDAAPVTVVAAPAEKKAAITEPIERSDERRTTQRKPRAATEGRTKRATDTVRYNISFRGKIIQDNATVQTLCGEITDELTSYAGVEATENWRKIWFHDDKVTIANLFYNADTLTLTLAVDPEKCRGIYGVIDAADKKRYGDTPTAMELATERHKYAAKKAISRMMLELGYAKRSVARRKNYVQPYETAEQLAESGLAREIK